MQTPCNLRGNYVWRFNVLLLSEQMEVLFDLHNGERRNWLILVLKQINLLSDFSCAGFRS